MVFVQEAAEIVAQEIVKQHAQAVVNIMAAKQ